MKRHFFFVLLLLLGILAAGCSRPATTSLPAEVDQHLAWIPATVEGLAYFDLQSLRQSELAGSLEEDWRERITRFRENRDYREFLEKTGFDFEKDLHRVLAGAESDQHDEMNRPTLVATGNFDEQKIISALDSLREARHRGKPHGLFAETYAGKTIYVTVEDSAHALYFADAHTVVFGEKAWVQKVIDGKTAGESVKQNEALMSLMERLPYKDQCWFIANTEEMAERVAEWLAEHRGFKGTRAVKALQGVIFSATVGEKARLYGEVLCDTEENCETLADAAKGALASAKLAVSDDREAVDMLNRIGINVEGKSVKISANLDKAFFDKMRERAEKHGRVAGVY
jgi:hypothetical protein